MLNCKKCTSRIVILTKKIQFTEYNTVPKKPKEEDTESKSETNSGYKDMMFSNTHRILIGEGYQAGMPEFLLNKPLSKNF